MSGASEPGLWGEAALGPALLSDGLGAARDDLYAELLAAHEGLDAAGVAALNARLVLILMNQLGDPGAIRAALAAARPGPQEAGR